MTILSAELVRDIQDISRVEDSSDDMKQATAVLPDHRGGRHADRAPALRERIALNAVQTGLAPRWDHESRKWHAVAACVAAGEFGSIEFGTRR
jgi:hypothetical protein